MIQPYAALKILVAKELSAQSGAAFLWLAAAYAGGIALFFAWPTDLWPWMGIGMSGVAALALALRRKNELASVPLFALCAVGLGLTAAQVRTVFVASPVLGHEIGPREIVGRVFEVEREPGRIRVMLDHVRLDEIPGARLQVRLSVPAKHGAPRVGQIIAVRAVLRPPERPVIPGGFEYQRYLYFQRIGALGFTLQPWRPHEMRANVSLLGEMREESEVLRRDISDRILSLLPGDEGAVAVALVTGEQSLITERTQEAYRVSGLAHLLSISGLHMSLLAGVVFVLVRRSLALWPWFALRRDLKKIAACAALAATTFYVLISGMSVPAMRAFIMVAVVMVAVLADRRAISLRSVALAALALLTLYPEALTGPSFQMSFMAVIALVALYEHVRLTPIWRGTDGEWRIGQALLIYFAALVVTDLVAGSITSIFAAYHFNRVPSYSLAANTIAAPVTGLWVMPWGLIALASMPFGLDAFFWKLMGAGVNVINGVATAVSKWPGAQIHVPPMPASVLFVAAVGVLLMCLWKGRLRWAGTIPIAAACVWPWLMTSPDVLLDESGRVIAVTSSDGVVLNPSRRDRFVRSVMKDRYGESKLKWPKAGERSEELGLACDAAGCRLERNTTTIALGLSPAAVAEDCGSADVLIAPQQFDVHCEGSFVIDRGNLWRGGGHAIYVKDGRVRLETVDDAAGNRVWSRKPMPRSRSIETGDAEDESPEDQ